MIVVSQNMNSSDMIETIRLNGCYCSYDLLLSLANLFLGFKFLACGVKYPLFSLYSDEKNSTTCVAYPIYVSF